MIDTITIRWPYLSELDKQKWIKHSNWVTAKRDIDGSTEWAVYKQDIELGSWDYHRNLKILEDYVELEFSVPKSIQGHNISLINEKQFNEALETLEKDLCVNHSANFPSYKTWEIVRLDICHCWKLPNQEESQSIFDVISNLNYPRKGKMNFPTSVEYIGSDYTVKFYLKLPEFIKHFPAVRKTEDRNNFFNILKYLFLF